VLAVPVPAILELLDALIARPPRASLVIDVGSVKGPIVAAGRRLAAFVGTHPIAGAATSGAAGAEAGLFRGRTWTYEPSAAEPARAAAVALIERFGARPFPLPAAEHDLTIALTSHLPQVVAVALAALLGESLDRPAVRALSGPGIASMTRLASSPWSMWEGIHDQNGPATAQEVRQLVDILSEAAAALESGESGALEARYDAAAAALTRLNNREPEEN